jgi:hypothetical protein
MTDASGEINGVYITKNNAIPRNISEFFGIDTDLHINTFDRKYNDKKDSTTGKGTVQSFAELEIDLAGVLIETRCLLTVDTEFSDEDVIAKKIKFTDVIGIFSDEDEETEGLVTGSVKAGKGKTINL